MSDPSSFLSLALKVLADRVAVLLALGMSFALFCWSIWAGSVISLCTAAAFAALVFLPVLWKGGSRGDKDG